MVRKRATGTPPNDPEPELPPESEET